MNKSWDKFITIENITFPCYEKCLCSECQAKLEAYKKAKQEERERIKQILYGEIDWIKVFKDAYENRKTSWWKLGHIQEWRNATDEICFALWKQLKSKLE